MRFVRDNAGGRGSSRVTTRRRWPPSQRTRPTRVRSRASARRPPSRSTGARIALPSQRSLPRPGNVWPIKLELVRATLLVALAVLFITLVLPAMLELAAAPFR